VPSSESVNPVVPDCPHSTGVITKDKAADSRVRAITVEVGLVLQRIMSRHLRRSEILYYRTPTLSHSHLLHCAEAGIHLTLRTTVQR